MDILSVCDYISFESKDIRFIGRGNIWIKNNFDTPSITAFIDYLLMNALANTASSQLEIIGFDSNLSGVFSPFSRFITGEHRIIRMIDGYDDLDKYLDFLINYISIVQNTMEGVCEKLIDYRNHIHRKPIESYKLFVIVLNDIYDLDDRTRVKLATIMRRSYQAGVTIVISADYGNNDYFPMSFGTDIQVCEVDGTDISFFSEGTITEISKYPGIEISTIPYRCEEIIQNALNTPFPSIDFTETINSEEFWSMSSKDSLKFVIGVNGQQSTEIVLGDDVNQRHNILVTGAVGQGKSNLLSVIIHNLCYNYSPDEIELFILDYKEGVSLKQYSNIDKEDYLPHAKVLGLESDVKFGLSVLFYLFDCYKNRMQLFKKHNVSNLQKYRDKTGEKLARIVVIIDEFQLMFGDDLAFGNKVADLLEKGVRLFRAAGIHFILSSQTISGNQALLGKGEAVFSQIPIRLVHKNSIEESHRSLSIYNDAAAYLRPREAIVNLDYGLVSQNQKTIVAYADENVLDQFRIAWWEKWKDKQLPPNIFESDRLIYLDRPIEQSGTPKIYIGEKISVEKECVGISMDRESGKNVAILGVSEKENNTAIGMMLSSAISLAQQVPEALFIICDFSGIWAKRFVKILSTFTSNVELVNVSDFYSRLRELEDYAFDNQNPVYVFGIEMDKLQSDQIIQGVGTNPVLRNLLELGPHKDIHFFGWWVKESKLKEQTVGYKPDDIFNTKIFLKIDSKSVQRQTNSIKDWKYQANRALLYDEIAGSGWLEFIPYSELKE